MSVHIKGLHQAGGLSMLHSVAHTADRSKLAAMLSRLEHQRALITRQLTVWTQKKQVTEHRLSRLDKEIAQVGRLIRQVAGPRRTVNQRAAPRAIKSGSQERNGMAAARPGGIAINY